MDAPALLTNFEHFPDPENPGWTVWRITAPECFNNAVLGKLILRREGESTCRVRMVPQAPLHTNSGGKVHGGVTLALIDVSLFAAGYAIAGIDAGRSVTVDLSTQFIGAGDAARPLDCVVELLRETGRLAFLRGTVAQENDLVAAFNATIRKSLAPRP